MTLPTATEQALRAEVRHALGTAEVRSAVDRYRAAVVAGDDPDPRPVYRLLGARRLLAVHWPPAYGGRGRPPVEHAAVVDELTLAGVPDTLHTLSVQIVGTFLLTAGTQAQRATWLPGLAAGELGAAVLYTEPDAGSDLPALTTRAEPAPDDGWRLSGRKVYGVQSRHAGLGLCLARTAEAATPYQGLTLFLVPLDAPGVEVRTLPTGADEQYADVLLDGVRVGADAVVGPVGRAWPLVTGALALERTGVDTAAKARRWLDAAARAVAALPSGDADLGVPLGRLTAQVDAAGLLARAAAADGPALDPGTGARTKVWCAETAREVAWWATDVLGPATLLGPDEDGAVAGGLLGSAYREAAGLTISAGTSEVLLDLVAAGLPAGDGPDEPPDPLAARIAGAVHALAASGSPQWTDLAEVGLFRLTVPVVDGGLDLGLAAAAAACTELGRAGVDGGLLDTLTAADRLLPDDLLRRCLEGRLRVAVVDERGRARDAAAADCLLLAGPGRLVPRDASGLSVRPSPSTVDMVRGGAGGLAVRAVPPTADRVRTAAWLSGLAAGGLALTVRRVRERRQFGRAVADNQAVGHRLARCAIRIDAVRSLVADSAARADAGDPDAGRAAAAAVAMAAETAAYVLRSGVQLHGAYGTTTAAPIARLAALLPLVASRCGRVPALWREAVRPAAPRLRAVGS